MISWKLSDVVSSCHQKASFVRFFRDFYRFARAGRAFQAEGTGAVALKISMNLKMWEER